MRPFISPSPSADLDRPPDGLGARWLVVKSTDRRRPADIFLPPQKQNGSRISQARREFASRGAVSMLREQSIVCDPEELSLLGQILDQVLESLPVAMRTPRNRTEIAKSLLACVATGERDPIKLKLAATIDLKPSITKTERCRSANLLQMPRGLMCKLR
jgi:hypothetical protein